MKRLVQYIGLAVFLGLATVSEASASPFSAFRPTYLPSSTVSLEEGREQLAPLPFVMFCMQYHEECQKTSSTDRVELTTDRFAELNDINRRVNAAIRPQVDTSQGRFWKLDVDAGDCNEFAVQKRHELIKAGWPAAALSLTVAKTTWGEGHLLVTVRTDHGDLVLDSLREEIVAWDKAHYRWIMRQSAADLTTWVALDVPTRHHHTHPRENTPAEVQEVPLQTAATPVLTSMTARPEPRTGRLIGL